MVYKLEFLVIFLLLVFVNFVIVVKKEMIKFKKKKKLDYIYKLFFFWFIKVVYE